MKPLLSDWPVDPPRDWVAAVNRPFSPKELERIRACVKRNRPYGSAIWQKQTATRLGLMASLRPEGRPRKKKSA